MVLAGKEGLSFQHLGEDTACTPNIHLDVVLLPSEHDLRSSVVSGRHIAGHLRILNTGQAKVANFQVAVLVDKDVARLQVTVDHTGGMNVFQSTLKSGESVSSSSQCRARVCYKTDQNLVQEVLNELLLQWTGGQETVEVSSEKLGDKVTAEDISA